MEQNGEERKLMELNGLERKGMKRQLKGVDLYRHCYCCCISVQCLNPSTLFISSQDGASHDTIRTPWKGEERKEKKGKERKGKEWNGMERNGKEWKGN